MRKGLKTHSTTWIYPFPYITQIENCFWDRIFSISSLDRRSTAVSDCLKNTPRKKSSQGIISSFLVLKIFWLFLKAIVDYGRKSREHGKTNFGLDGGV